MKSTASQQEQEHVTKFTKAKDSTHIRVVSNSVGMVLLELIKNYVKNDRAMHILYSQCASELKSIGEKDEKLKSAVDYIIKKVQERSDVYDTVTLSIPDAKSFKEVEHTFPLREVLALVWKAINDDEKFVQNYQGNEAEKLKQAQKDKPMRLESFYSCLERIRNEQVCHHGNRNELVFTLNNIYKDVNLIEDEKSTILNFLRDKLNQQFLETYQDKKLNNQTKRKLALSLFQWMESDNASDILSQIDPTSIIIKELGNLFIKNGVSPESIHLDKLVAETIPYIVFSCDPIKYRLFYSINNILNFPDDKNPALNQMQLWIKKEIPLEKPKDQQKIKDFARIYQAYLEIPKNKFILEITGQNFNALYSDIDDYLKTNRLAKDTLEKIDSFYDAVEKAKREKFTDQIANYFSAWYEALKSSDGATIKNLYTLLLTDKITNKIILTDVEITQAMKDKTKSGKINVTPYLINRIFLHAILIEPGSWSPIFKEMFETVLQFVENNFNHPKYDLVKAALKKDSYPQVLIDQLHYLSGDKKDIKDTKDIKAIDDRPSNLVTLPGEYPRMLMLPWRCHQIRELRYFMSALDEKLQESVYSANTFKIHQLILKDLKNPNSNTPLSLLFSYSIPKNYQLAFLKSDCGKEIIKLGTKTPRELANLLDMPESYWPFLLETNQKQLHNLINHPRDLYEFLIYAGNNSETSEKKQLFILNFLDTKIHQLFEDLSPLDKRYWFQTLDFSLYKNAQNIFKNKLNMPSILEVEKDYLLKKSENLRQLPNECFTTKELVDSNHDRDQDQKAKIFLDHKEHILRVITKELEESLLKHSVLRSHLAQRIIRFLPDNEIIPFFDSSLGQKVISSSIESGADLAYFFEYLQELPVKLWDHFITKTLANHLETFLNWNEFNNFFIVGYHSNENIIKYFHPRYFIDYLSTSYFQKTFQNISYNDFAKICRNIPRDKFSFFRKLAEASILDNLILQAPQFDEVVAEALDHVKQHIPDEFYTKYANQIHDLILSKIPTQQELKEPFPQKKIDGPFLSALKYIPTNKQISFFKSEKGLRMLTAYLTSVDNLACAIMRVIASSSSIKEDFLQECVKPIVPRLIHNLTNFSDYISPRTGMEGIFEYEKGPNQINLLNTFSDEYFNALFSFSQKPSSDFRKIFKSLSLQGRVAFLVKLKGLQSKYFLAEGDFISENLSCKDLSPKELYQLPKEYFKLLIVNTNDNSFTKLLDDEKKLQSLLSSLDLKLQEVALVQVKITYFQTLEKIQILGTYNDINSLKLLKDKFISLPYSSDNVKSFIAEIKGLIESYKALTPSTPTPKIIQSISNAQPMDIVTVLQNCLNTFPKQLVESTHSIKVDLSSVAKVLPSNKSEFDAAFLKLNSNLRLEYLKTIDLNFLKSTLPGHHYNIIDNLPKFQYIEYVAFCTSNNIPFSLHWQNLVGFLDTIIKIDNSSWTWFFNIIGHDAIKQMITQDSYYPDKKPDDILSNFLKYLRNYGKLNLFLENFGDKGLAILFKDEKHLEGLLSSLKVDPDTINKFSIQLRQLKPEIDSKTNVVLKKG